MRRLKPALFLAFLIFFFCAFANVLRAAGSTNLCSGDPIPSVWTKEDSPYVICTSVNVNYPVTIEPGVIVKFKKNASATFSDSVIAIGTKDEKIVFTAYADDEHGGDTDGDLGSYKPAEGYWNRILVETDATVQFENSVFLYGGEHPFGALRLQSRQPKTISVKKSEFKHNKYAGIYLDYSPDQTIEKNTFSSNGEGVVLGDCYKKTTATIANNSFLKNTNFGAKVTYSSQNTIDARNNWWGDKTGPTHKNNPEGKGDRISSGVTFDPWIGKDGFDPVIFIPGILGSWEVNGEWKIDPILHSFENLRKALSENGYAQNVDMFDFPYQWRDSNIKNAKLLGDAIDVVKEKTNRPKVDIIAHSMGGLLAREYIESDYYQDDVDQLITLGTPHDGAPKAYLMWEAGEADSFLEDRTLKMIFNREARKAGYENILYYIQDKIPSLQELLPVYDYIFDVNLGSLRYYPERYPQNYFLEDINGEKVNKLKNIEFDNIYGRVDKKTTIGGYNVTDAPAFGDYWKHGYPKDFDFPWSNEGLNYEDGDGTVPAESAKSINSDKEIEVKSDHAGIPTEAQQDVIELLIGKRPTDKITSEGAEIKEILLVQVYCPIDMQVISPDGKKIGTDFENNREINEISGAAYINNSEDEEFVTIPNPEDGEYEVVVQGTGEGGNYEVEIAKIGESGDNSNNPSESSVIIEDEIQADETKEMKVEVTDDRVVYNSDKFPPVINIFSPEEKTYSNDYILTINYKTEDSESGVSSDFWHVEKDGQNLGWQDKSIDLSLEHLGKYVFEVGATDAAGNFDTGKVEFQVTTNISALQKNLYHYWDLKLIKKKVAYKYFSREFKNLERLFDLLEKTKNSKFKTNPKQATVKSLEKVINMDANRIIRQIKKKSPHWIDPKAADLMIEDISFMQNNLLDKK